MRIVSIGGGPAGLYFGILMKKGFPAIEVEILERHRPEETFGFGVVFSDETLSFFDEVDGESAREIRRRFRAWRDIEIRYRGGTVVSTGHGFAALGRAELLGVLSARAEALGCRLRFGEEIQHIDRHLDADLVLGADGVNSRVRDRFREEFRPWIELRSCRFSWLGADFALPSFTFVFEESALGLFQAHAYPYAAERSTWIVECHEETWRRAGLDRASEEESVALCEQVFARHLQGRRLLANRSIWRQFPIVRCERWHHRNVVLLGDAAHTAHFSIGSGTKLAMEDAIALAGVFHERGLEDVPAVLVEYEAQRRGEATRLQRAAETSLEWFENSRRYLRQSPATFAFNLMTRSKRITYDNLRARDPLLVDRADRAFAETQGRVAGVGPVPPPIFQPFRAREVELANRIVVSPMCQYSAVDGLPNDWHLVHLGSRAVGGAGLVLTEMTDVEPEGRISLGCAGLYRREHLAGWRRIVEFVHGHSPARIGVQLAHAGRKGSVRHPWSGEDVPLAASEGGWTTLAPSAVPYRPEWPAPKEMDAADLSRVQADFERAARWSDEIGFDWLELHFAHGYLLSSFLSPLANRRADAYGGSLDNRMRYPLAVFRAVRAAWPAGKPISVRLSATDWMEDGSGITPDETVVVARALKEAGCDLVDVSSGGNSPAAKPAYGRMYQVRFAEQIRHEAGIPVMAVGAILDADHANTVLAAERADLVVMARPHLADPYLTLRAATRYGVDLPWPGPYLRGKPAPTR